MGCGHVEVSGCGSLGDCMRTDVLWVRRVSEVTVDFRCRRRLQDGHSVASAGPMLSPSGDGKSGAERHNMGYTPVGKDTNLAIASHCRESMLSCELKDRYRRHE